MAKWSAEFKRGRDSLEDDPRPGRPADLLSQEMIDRVERLVLNNHQIKVAELASECGISNGSVYTIINVRHVKSICQVGTQKPEYARSSAKGGVKSRTSGSVQCQSRRHTRLVTGDETWLHHWDPDTKKESMQWKHPGSPSPKKFRSQPSASKVMATVFWDSKEIILIDYKPVGTSITGEYYANVIK